MKIDQKWVEAAERALLQVGIVQNGQYPKAYKGYISSLNASIIQSGLIPALAFYENEDSQADNDRGLLLNAILVILKEKKLVPDDYQKFLSDYMMEYPDKKEVRRGIDKSLVALKLAIRMYKASDQFHIKKKKSNPESEDPSRQAQQRNNIEETEIVATLSDYEKGSESGNLGWLYYRDFYRNFTKKKVTIVYQEKVKKKINQRKTDWVKKLMKKENNSTAEWRADHQELLFLKKYRTICESDLKNFSHYNLSIIALLKKMNHAVGVGEDGADTKKLPAYTFLELKTLYPGLLIGAGLSHGTKCVNDIKIGFQFDFTTGLPVIPGSSVKGVLCSMFPNPQLPSDCEYNQERFAYIRSVLHEKCGVAGEVSDDDILSLTYRLFQGGENNGCSDYMGRDVFMDALLTASDNGNQQFMGDDFITPHKKPLENPVPIQFLKVLPGVTFTFVFRLTSTRIGHLNFDPDCKLKLFKQILLDVGVGAKTNVGYGHLEEV